MGLDHNGQGGLLVVTKESHESPIVHCDKGPRAQRELRSCVIRSSDRSELIVCEQHSILDTYSIAQHTALSRRHFSTTLLPSPLLPVGLRLLSLSYDIVPTVHNHLVQTHEARTHHVPPKSAQLHIIRQVHRPSTNGNHDEAERQRQDRASLRRPVLRARRL